VATTPASFASHRDGQMRFADTGRPDEH
jgi:hypothetical protein